MARARNIKPNLFKNEILGVADPLYTLLFEGLWVLADREGRVEDRPLRIKGEIFPYRATVDVDSMLWWLQSKKFIYRYTAECKNCILVLEFKKHQNPHKNEAESELPPPDASALEKFMSTPEKIGSARDTQEEAEAGTREIVRTQYPSDIQGIPEKIGSDTEFIGSTRADSLNLIPDSLNLIPDSLKLIPEVPAAENSAPAQKSKPAQQHPSATAYVWEAYSTAYFNRYGTEPVRNAKVNSQLSQLVKRIGESEAPSVASFYVGHQASYYVSRMHPVDCLLSDAEKLRTEWATGRRMTATKAQQTDKTATNLGAFQALIEAAEAEERANGQR